MHKAPSHGRTTAVELWSITFIGLLAWSQFFTHIFTFSVLVTASFHKPHWSITYHVRLALVGWLVVRGNQTHQILFFHAKFLHSEAVTDFSRVCFNILWLNYHDL